MAGGNIECAYMKSQDCINDMELRSSILHKILKKNTAEPLTTVILPMGNSRDILEVQRMWEKLGEENLTLDKMELCPLSTYFPDGQHLINRRLFSLKKLAHDAGQCRVEKVIENASKIP